MGSSVLDVKLEGFDSFIMAVRKASYGKLGELMSFLGEGLVNTSQDAFETQVDPVSGSSWAERSDGSSNSLLRDTRDLFRSLGYSIEGGDLHIGSSMSYSSFHQEGTKHMQARGFLDRSEKSVKSLFEDDGVRDILSL